jgi:hypothetical protein
MARYVLLRIEDDDEADTLLRDLAVAPNSPLLTPRYENPVHVELVPSVDTSDLRNNTIGAPPTRSGERAGLLSFVAASYQRGHELAAEWEAS